MGNNLKPIGSEKLDGLEKIQRIMEIARYKENIPTSINEDKSTEYTKVLADGRTYKIDKEKNGYILKRSLTESRDEFDYMEPMKNRKYYSSYSQALKRLNLVAKEINVNENSEKNVNLFYESSDHATKYILKMNGGETSEQVAQAPAQSPTPAPAPAQSTTPAPAPELDDEPIDDMDLDTEPETDLGDEDDNEPITLKLIQKITGRLAQKIRAFRETEEGQQMSSRDIKYVINSVLASLDLDSLEEEDKEEIMNKFEGGEEDQDMGDFNPDDMGGEEEPTDVPSEEPTPAPEGEMGEGFDDFNVKSKFSDYDDKDFEEIDLHKDFEPRHPRHRSLKHPDLKDDEAGHLEDMIEGMFTESKVDKIIEGYFKYDSKEKQLIESKKRRESLLKEDRKQKITKIKKLSESISQEVGSTKFLNQNPTAKLIGKTNKKNLVFEMKGNQYRVNTKGQIL